MTTHYDLLGVSRSASRAEIRRAANRLARKYHSDTSENGRTDDRYQKVVEAKAVLTNQKRREAYDRSVFGDDYEETPAAPTFSFTSFFRSDFLRKAREGVKVEQRKEPFVGSLHARRMMLIATIVLGLVAFGTSLFSWFSAVFLGVSLVASPSSAIIENLIGIIVLVAVSIFRTYWLGRLRTGVSFAVAFASFLLFASTSTNGLFASAYFLLSGAAFLLMLTRSRPSSTVERRADSRVPAREDFIKARSVFGDDRFSQTDDPISEPLRRETGRLLSSMIHSADIDNSKVFNRVENADVVADHVVLSGSDIILVASAQADHFGLLSEVSGDDCRVFTPGAAHMRNSIRNLRMEFPRSRVRGVLVVASTEEKPQTVHQERSGEIHLCSPDILDRVIGSTVAKNSQPVDLDIAGYLLRSCTPRQNASSM